MALQETAVLNRVVFYDDIESPSESIPLLLASPDSEGEIRTGIEEPLRHKLDTVDYAIGKTMLLFGRQEIASQLARLANTPQESRSTTVLANGQAVVLG